MKVYVTIMDDAGERIFQKGIVIDPESVSLDRVDRAVEVLKQNAWVEIKKVYEVKESFIASSQDPKFPIKK